MKSIIKKPYENQYPQTLYYSTTTMSIGDSIEINRELYSEGLYAIRFQYDIVVTQPSGSPSSLVCNLVYTDSSGVIVYHIKLQQNSNNTLTLAEAVKYTISSSGLSIDNNYKPIVQRIRRIS